MYKYNSAPSGSPGGLSVKYPEQPTIAKLSWTPVPQEKRNGVITGYSVKVTTINSSTKKTVTVIEKTDVIDTYTEVPNLSPFTVYHFCISANTKAGPGPEASISSKTDEGGKH